MSLTSCLHDKSGNEDDPYTENQSGEAEILATEEKRTHKKYSKPRTEYDRKYTDFYS